MSLSVYSQYSMSHHPPVSCGKAMLQVTITQQKVLENLLIYFINAPSSNYMLLNLQIGFTELVRTFFSNIFLWENWLCLQEFCLCFVLQKWVNCENQVNNACNNVHITLNTMARPIFRKRLCSCLTSNNTVKCLSTGAHSSLIRLQEFNCKKLVTEYILVPKTIPIKTVTFHNTMSLI